MLVYLFRLKRRLTRIPLFVLTLLWIEKLSWPIYLTYQPTLEIALGTLTLRIYFSMRIILLPH